MVGGAKEAFGDPRNGRARERAVAPPPAPGFSFQNFVNSFYYGLPPFLRDLFPFQAGEPGEEKEVGPTQDKRGKTSWRDVCFI